MQGIVTSATYVNKGLSVGTEYAGRIITYVSSALPVVHADTHTTQSGIHTHIHTLRHTIATCIHNT